MMTNLKTLCILAVVAMGFFSEPLHAKKSKPEPTLFDECPLDETLRVAADASLKGLESLANCDDVEVSPADAKDMRPLPSVRHRPYSQESSFVAQSLTAELEPMPISRGKVRQGQLKADLKTGTDASQGSNVMSLQTSGLGAIFVRIRPEQTEFDYGSNSFGAPESPWQPQTANLQGDAIFNWRPVRYTTQFDQMIGEVARRHRVDPLLLHAVIKQESGYRGSANSHVGARGLMQIMPGTGSMLGVNPGSLWDPGTNVDAGARLLRKLAFKYGGNFDLVLAAYNAGEGAVQKYGNRIPPYRETQDYVRKVMGNYNQLLNDNLAGSAKE